MKNLLIIGYFLLNSINLNCKNPVFIIDIFDYNYSMSNTLHYHLTRDSVTVMKLDGLAGKHSVVLLKKQLTIIESNNILNVIKSPAFRNLKHEYKNPLIEDGDRKRISIQLDKEKKTIEISNVYNKVIAQLIGKVNLVFDEKYSIRYIKQ